MKKNTSFTLATSLALSLVANIGASFRAYAADTQAQTEETKPIVLEASGTGLDEEKALKQALKNAIRQAVGTIVDAETILKNDQIIKDQILTASSAIVTKVERVGKPEVEDGLVSVRIKATVERGQLVGKLQETKVLAAVAKVDGESMWAKMTTELEKEQDAAKIVDRIFEGYPCNITKIEIMKKPEVAGKRNGRIVMRMEIKVSVDEEKYAAFVKTITPFLEKIAVEKFEGACKRDNSGKMDFKAPEPIRTKGITGLIIYGKNGSFVGYTLPTKTYPKVLSLYYTIPKYTLLALSKAGKKLTEYEQYLIHSGGNEGDNPRLLLQGEVPKCEINMATPSPNIYIEKFLGDTVEDIINKIILSLSKIKTAEETVEFQDDVKKLLRQGQLDSSNYGSIGIFKTHWGFTRSRSFSVEFELTSEKELADLAEVKVGIKPGIELHIADIDGKKGK